MIRRFYKAVDAFVLPSRGEGWGRPHVEVRYGCVWVPQISQHKQMWGVDASRSHSSPALS
jgi:glycosyltransferase involved in cell wall biosynthesis